MPRLAASVAMMFREVELLDRFELAAAAGFRGVEVQSPYGETKEDIADRLRRHDLTPVLFNVEPAVGAIPGREAQFRAGVTRALDYARETGCRQLHCLAGRAEGYDAENTFVTNLTWAAQAADPFGVRVLVEPLNTRDNPGYFLTRTDHARRIVERVACDNVALQYDVYHMQIMEGNVSETITANLDMIRHIQVSGVPGRHEPDARQELNYPYLLELVDSHRIRRLDWL